MIMKGKKCPACEKGFLKKIKELLEEGIYADALRCTYCGESFYSEKVMQNVEAVRNADTDKRNLVKIGHSLAAIIPATIVKKLHLHEKESVFIREKNNTIIINSVQRK